MTWTVSTLYPTDKIAYRKWQELLEQEGIQPDKNITYTCGIYDDQGNLIATGSSFANTLRCLAVDNQFQGEGLLNLIVSHLTTYQFEQGNRHLFLYTKPGAVAFFKNLGFYEIVLTNTVAFMENKKDGFSNYLAKLTLSQSHMEPSAAIVMNANPFTLGHLYLIEKACAENALVHLFIVSDDSSLIPYAVRKCLVKEGTAHLQNLIYQDTDSYMISQATFPSYFQKDSQAVIKSQAAIDLHVFSQIAKHLHITKRYVGEEPYSQVTQLYNETMESFLPKEGIDLIIVPRKLADREAISASQVRQLLKEGKIDALKKLVPLPTLTYFQSPEAQPVIKRIQMTENVKHY